MTGDEDETEREMAGLLGTASPGPRPPSVRTTTKARVTLTVELDVGSAWGQECSTGQVYDQAGRQAEAVLRRALRDHALTVKVERVVAVTTELFPQP